MNDWQTAWDETDDGPDTPAPEPVACLDCGQVQCGCAELDEEA